MESLNVVMPDDIAALGTRCDTLEGYYSDLASRVTFIETDTDSSLAARCGALETAVSNLNTWRAAKATKILPISTTPADSSITILGIQVPTASSFTALLNFAIAIRNQNNAILGLLTSREMMAP